METFDFNQYFNNVIEHNLIRNNELENNKNEGKIVNFEPILAFDIMFKNKTIFNAFSDDYYIYNNTISEKFYEFYENIAKSDVGMIVTGGFYAGISEFQYKIDFENLDLIKRFQDINQKIHTQGTKIFLKIKTQLGRANNKKFLNIFNYSASHINSYNDSNMPTIRISDQKCNEIINDIITICIFAGKTDFDGVFIDCGLDNVLGELLSCEFNKRKFGYFSNNLELINQVLHKLKKINFKLPIILRVNAETFINEIFDKNVKKVNSLSKICKIKNNFFQEISQLITSGVDGFIFNFGVFENGFLNSYNAFQENCLYQEFYNKVNKIFKEKKLCNKFNEIPIIINTDNLDTSDIINLITTKDKNFVDITKNLLADNDFLLKLKMQKATKYCIKCNKCVTITDKFKFNKCIINPDTFIRNKKNILPSKHICVVGGGISGIVCSLTLLFRGYSVDLFEEASCILKYSNILSVFGSDIYMNKYMDYLNNMLDFYKNSKKMQIFTSTELCINNDTEKYDSIIVATGFCEKPLEINGSILKHVFSIYDDKLCDKIKNANNITIYIKSELSLRICVYLLLNNKNITIAISDLNFLFNIPTANLSYYFYMFDKFKAKVYFQSYIKAINDDSCELIINNKLRNIDSLTIILNILSKKIYKYIPASTIVDTDLFIYEPDIVSNNKLYYELVKAGYKGELYLIGSALQISNLEEDIKSAYYVGKNI